MTDQLHNATVIGRAITDNLRYWFSGRWRQSGPKPEYACRVPPDFFGICVASAPDAACDEYVIARLKELGISRVRLDFTYDSRGAYGERFLARLLNEQFRVCLHLVQPLTEAKALAAPEAQDRWRTFIAETLEVYGPRLDLVEIGSTCNRRRWSGYTPASFLLSWQIAWDEAQQHGLTPAGPNVTDFEPFYNVFLLGAMKRSGRLPSFHTDNLFVERATEPEAFDHKILGYRLADVLQFNLVRKARVIRDIGQWAGVPETLCTHTAWSLRRIARLLDHIEEKQADYVARYGCLAAASGALRRIYWGPLIGQREGLIDDGTSIYPDIPHVTFYGHVHGHLADYRLRPAYSAFQTVNRFLSGALFRRKIPTGPGLEILEFVQMQNAELSEFEGRTTNASKHQSTINHQPSTINQQPSTILHVVWTTNGNCVEATACYTPETLKAAKAYSRDGDPLAQPPVLFSERPVYLVWPADSGAGAQFSAGGGSAYGETAPATSRSALEKTAPINQAKITIPGIIAGVRFASIPGTSYAPIHQKPWTGFYLAESAGKSFDPAPLLTLLPGPRTETSENQAIASYPAVILRDSRNRVWSVPAPGERGCRWVIKQFKPRSFWRRLVQRHQPDRAQRSWNGAQELLRRGIPTPQPVAFIHAAEGPDLHDSFYICRAFENGWSAREAFTAFSRGARHFQGKSDTDLFAAIAQFLRTLHDRGVFFRDLSAGNLLFHCAAEAEIEFALIDTTRARFYPASVGLRHRLCDLIRLCHPLHWKGRRELVGLYMQFIGKNFNLWMQIPFAYYDAKHGLKKAFKRLRVFD